MKKTLLGLVLLSILAKPAAAGTFAERGKLLADDISLMR